MKKLIITITTLLLSGASLMAQDRSNAYNNLLNPFVYNPALAGSYTNIYAAFNARSIVGGIDGSPRFYNFALHAPLKNETGLGVKIVTSSVAAFQSVNAEGAYSKKVKFSENHSVTLGLFLGFTQTNIRTELLNGQVDLSDQTITSKDLNRVLLSSGAGAVYRYGKKAELGIAFPSLITGDHPLNGMMVANGSYNFFTGVDKEYKIKPMLNYYNLKSSPSMVDMLINASWKDVVSLTGGYRTNGSIIMGAGFNFKSISVNYAYYHHVADLQKLAPAQNELCIGFYFAKPVSEKKNNAKVLNDQIIEDELDRMNERLNGLVNVEKSNPGMVNMKKEISKLNKDLDKLLDKYQISKPAQLDKIKLLQTNLEVLITKYHD